MAKEVSLPLVFHDNPTDICCGTKGPSHTEQRALQPVFSHLETH